MGLSQAYAAGFVSSASPCPPSPACAQHPEPAPWTPHKFPACFRLALWGSQSQSPALAKPSITNPDSSFLLGIPGRASGWPDLTHSKSAPTGQRIRGNPVISRHKIPHLISEVLHIHERCSSCKSHTLQAQASNAAPGDEPSQPCRFSWGFSFSKPRDTLDFVCPLCRAWNNSTTARG